MLRMRGWSLLVLGICLVIPSGLAKKWNTNKDSIVVDASYSDDDEEGELHFDALDQPDRPECMTLDHEPGVCITLRRCHPILFSENGELRNPSLAQDYSQSVDACVAQNAVDDEPVNFDEMERSDKASVGERILCCAKDKIHYAHRSSLEASDEELAMYPTTTSYPVVPLGGEINEESTQRIDDLLVIDNGLSGPSAPSEPIVDVVESTGRPELQQESTNVPQKLSEESEITTSLPIVDSVQQEPQEPQAPLPTPEEPQSEPLVPEEPEPQPEQPSITAEDLMKPNEPTEACPAVSLYNTWPAFDNYPFLAAIQTRVKTGPLCSGSLIDNRHVLTAAHCLHRFNSRDVARMQVRIGFTKNRLNDTFNDYYLERKASKIIFHKRFHEQSKMDNNIALVQLDQPVEFDEHVAPIGIFSGARGFDVGNCSGVEAGWIKYGNRKVTGISGGVIHYIEPPTSDFVLREAINRIFTNAECQSQLFTEITEEMLCAKTDIFEAHGISTNQFRGNDGGPLVIQVGDRVQQVGIKSWAYEGHQYPTVYTRVSEYLDWIRNNLQM
ncbi:unnamed protein product [Orchesella dallaii]|uniref:Peptidase S1 domain-containing protein n=1 Tax=Orchesella dallaii TaxID=48710 RepID=A0ABP1S3W7_9HEXA